MKENKLIPFLSVQNKMSNYKMNKLAIVFLVLLVLVVLVLLVTSNREGYKSIFPNINTNLWPYYYNSFPYSHKYGGAWAPGMYTRLKYYSPGFYSGSGLTRNNRPGMGYKYWPRDRWIRNTGVNHVDNNGNTRSGNNNNYYNVTNADDYIHDDANYNVRRFLY